MLRSFRYIFLILCIACLMPAPVYASAESSGALIPACDGELYSYVDPDGQLIWPYRWLYCGAFRGAGYALVQEPSGTYSIITSDGTVMHDNIPFADEGAELGYYGGKDTGVCWLFDGSKYAFFDVISGYLSDYCFHENQDVWFDGACSSLLRITYDGETYGYVDRTNGRLVIPCLFSQINTVGFHNGLTMETLAETGKDVIVQESGAFLALDEGLTPSEDALLEDDRLLILNVQTGLYGYCDSTGQCVIPAIYENAENFCNGYAAVCTNGKWTHTDKNGAVMTTERFDAAYAFHNNRAFAILQHEPVLIQPDGTVVCTLSQDLQYFDFLPQGVAPFTDGQYTGLLRADGSEALPLSQQYSMDLYQSDAPLFADGLQPIMNTSGKWAYIDTNGMLATEFIYDQASPFTGGFAWAVCEGEQVLLEAEELCADDR